VRVTFVVQPNPVLRDVQVQANAGINVPSVLPGASWMKFSEQYGSIPQPASPSGRYQTQVVSRQGLCVSTGDRRPEVTADGTVNLSVAEGVVEDIQVFQQGR